MTSNRPRLRLPKYAVVAVLETTCGWIDRVLYWRPFWFVGWHCTLANWSGRLEDRWETGYWKPVPPERRFDDSEVDDPALRPMPPVQ